MKGDYKKVQGSVSSISATLSSRNEEISREFYQRLAKKETDPAWFQGWFQFATREPFEAVDFLMREIVQKGRCVGCAACVEICPVNVFDYLADKPKDTRHSDCVYCGLCAAVCPPAHLGSDDPGKFFIDGRDVKDEGFGRYRTAVLARSKEQDILYRAQDGGISSAIVIEALESGIIDGVVLGDTLKGEPLKPVPRLATTRQEILQCAGSRYTYSPNTAALREALDKNMRVAVVGVPCQINGLRHIQYGLPDGFDLTTWFKRNVAFSVGLFCSEVFTYEGLVDLGRKINVPLEDIVYINVKGKIISKTKEGTTKTSSLKDMRKYKRQACNYCWDYSAELADISLGGIGQDGWTFTVTRTAVGQALFDKLVKKDLIQVRPLDQDSSSKTKELLIKLSEKKRNVPKSYEDGSYSSH